MPKSSKSKDKKEKSIKKTSSKKSLKSSKSNKSLKTDKTIKSDEDNNSINNDNQNNQTEKNPLNSSQNIQTLNNNIYLNNNNNNFYNSLNNNNSNININNTENNTNNNSINNIKCEGCYTNDSIVFCKECNKNLCQICENQIHVIPLFKEHERVPISNLNIFKKVCYHHNNNLKFFCDSCEEPICEDCQIYGPHETKLHRIISIENAFSEKFEKFSKSVKNNIENRYEILNNNLKKIDDMINEINYNSINLERDINMNFNKILEEVRNEKGKKKAILNFESSLIQKELIKFDDIINFINDTKDNNDMLEFLIRYEKINNLIDYLLNKNYDINFDEDIDNFKNDNINNINENVQIKYEKLKKILEMKDNVIYDLLAKLSKLDPKYNKNNLNNIVSNNRYNDNNSNDDNIIKNIYNNIINDNVNFYQILIKFDNEDNGTILVNDLINCIQKIGITINQNEVEEMLSNLEIKNNDGKINIKDFTEAIVSYNK